MLTRTKRERVGLLDNICIYAILFFQTDVNLTLFKYSIFIGTHSFSFRFFVYDATEI